MLLLLSLFPLLLSPASPASLPTVSAVQTLAKRGILAYSSRFCMKGRTMGRRRDRKNQRRENQTATRIKNSKRKTRERDRKAAKLAAAAA